MALSSQSFLNTSAWCASPWAATTDRRAGPGWWVIPFIHGTRNVDLREDVIELAPQTCITRDNAPVTIDLIIFMRVVSPEEAVLKVQTTATPPKASPRPRCVPLLATSCWTTCLPSASASTASCRSSSTKLPSAGASRSTRLRFARSAAEGHPGRDEPSGCRPSATAAPVVLEAEGTPRPP